MKAVFVLLLIMIAVVLSKDVSVVVLIVLAVTIAVYGTITFFCLRRKGRICKLYITYINMSSLFYSLLLSKISFFIIER